MASSSCRIPAALRRTACSSSSQLPSSRAAALPSPRPLAPNCSLLQCYSYSNAVGSGLLRRAASPPLGSGQPCLRGVQAMASASGAPAPSAADAAEPPADLWRAVLDVYDKAQVSGASSKTDTKEDFYYDPTLGVEFVLRLAAALRAKPAGPPAAAAAEEASKAAKAKAGGEGKAGGDAKPVWRNPFLPPEPELYVCGLPPGHSLVLNKFNVVPHHLLVITKDFQSQADPLYAPDLAATWRVLKAMPAGGCAFYNCGPNSGRSQPHKHLQIVPLPFAAGRPAAIPMQPAIDAAAAAAGPGLAPLQPFPLRQLPYRCWAAKMPASPTPAHLEAAFNALLQACCAGAAPDGEPPSYNVLLTPQAMMLAARSAERVGPCALNSLAFAGTVLLRSEEEVEYVRGAGPSAMLAAVGVPW